VAVSAALGALFSSTVVAVVTVLLSSRFARTRDDADLRGVAGMLEYALTVKHYDPAHAALDQQQEHAHAGISVAVYQRQQRVAGDDRIRRVAPGECADSGEMRACAVAAGPWIAVAAREAALVTEQQTVATRAAGIAVILASICSGLAALALAAAAVDPLKKLASAVQGVPVIERGEAALGPNVGVKEVDALRATLQSAFDRHARALAQSRSFAEHAARKLRDPLSTIVRELEPASEHAHEERSHARRVAARLCTLVDRLLIFASTRDSMSRQHTMSLRGGVEQALETLPEGGSTRVVCTGPDVTLRADPALLVSAIVSALENALKYSQGAVRVCIEPGQGVVTLAVEDEGPGVSEAEREQVFLPFYRGKQPHARQTTGHGIGLAVIARVAQLHGGTARFGERTHGARLEMTFAVEPSGLS
jgi:signal transduction histidine kinase